jgi:hypothetical protein
MLRMRLHQVCLYGESAQQVCARLSRHTANKPHSAPLSVAVRPFALHERLHRTALRHVEAGLYHHVVDNFECIRFADQYFPAPALFRPSFSSLPDRAWLAHRLAEAMDAFDSRIPCLPCRDPLFNAAVSLPSSLPHSLSPQSLNLQIT